MTAHTVTFRMVAAADTFRLAADQTLNAIEFARDNDVIDAADTRIDQPVDVAFSPGHITVDVTVDVTADSDRRAREQILNAMDFARDNDVIDARDITFPGLPVA